MSDRLRLRPEERLFFERLARVLFSNPFTTDTTDIEALVGRLPGSGPRIHALAIAAPVANERLRTLEARGLRGLDSVSSKDRRLLEYGYLFQAYDRFVEQFDALIRKQIDVGERSAGVPFASDLMRLLKRYGFGADDAVRLIALFYQLRRAYFFIAHSLVGDSPSMERLRRALWDNVFTSDILAYREHLWNRMED
jgi:hypothetical protein